MQKTVVRNPNQSQIRRNLLNIAGITVQGETIAPPNGDRLLGGYGVAWLNNQDAASQTTGQDNPLPECNCESGGGGGGSGGGGGVQPSGNCEKKNISELKQILDDYASQSFCDKEFPDVQFSTFIGYDKPPSDSTAKEIELRMLCPVDDCRRNLIGGLPAFKGCDGQLITVYDEFEVEQCANGSWKLGFEPSCEICREATIKLFDKLIKDMDIQPVCGENTFYGYYLRSYSYTTPNMEVEGYPSGEVLVDYAISANYYKCSMSLLYLRPNGKQVITNCGNCDFGTFTGPQCPDYRESDENCNPAGPLQHFCS